MPTRVISEMLGVPYEDHEFFQHHANVGLARYASAEDGQKGAMSLHKYLINLVESKMANPSEDAVSDLAERVNAGEISVKEAAQLGTGLLIAGHETTANMIGIGVLALLENPEQAALLRDSDDPKFIANAAEELMRYLSIIQNGQRRVAIEDIEIGGETIRAGEGIIIDLAPANWDARRLSRTRQAGLHPRRGPAARLRLRPPPVRRAAARPRRAADRVPHAAAAHPDAEAGDPVRRGAVQARPARLRRLRTSRDLVATDSLHHSPIGVPTMSTPTAQPCIRPKASARPRTDKGMPQDAIVGLPAGTEIFSADNHISVADDIFYERFPEELKGAAPRIWYEDGAYMVGMKGKAWTGGDFGRVLMQYDDLAGAASNNIEARIRELPRTASTRNWRSPTPCWRCSTTRTSRCASGCSASTTSTSPTCRSARNGHFYGVGLINWWDPKGTRSTLAELKSLGLKTFLLPLNPGKDDDGNIYDYGSAAMDAVWDEIEEAGVPVSHHIGETPPKTPCENNSVVVGMMVNVDSFREQFAKYVFSGILDRHPKLKIGWFEGGIAWVPTALQDAEHMLASYRHMFNHQLDPRRPPLLEQPHERLVHGRSARPAADRQDRRGQRDVVVGLPAQRDRRSDTRRSR